MRPALPPRRLSAPLLLLALTSSLVAGGLGLAAGPAAADADPVPVCTDAGACTVTFPFTGAPQAFTVPAGVHAVDAVVDGATGGAYFDGAPGGRGGRSLATLHLTPGEVLTAVVGQRGAPLGSGGTRTFGGGGAGNASGGGGTYLADAYGIMLASGGGGGWGNPYGAGDGGGANAYGAQGGPYDGSGTAGLGAAPFAGGGGNGVHGTGPATITSFDTGGDGISGGGGGGGGFFGGGGGFTSAGAGGGGSGYARLYDPKITDIVPSTAPVGAGGVTLSWHRPGVVLSPKPATTVAGRPVHFTVDGDLGAGPVYDATADSTVTATPADGSGAPVACPDGECLVTGAGSYDITGSTVLTGDTDPTTDTTTLTVLPGDLARLDLTPDIDEAVVGTPVTYTAEGADAFGNDLGDLTADAAVVVAPAGGRLGDPVACPAAVCTPTVAGTFRVLATIGDVTTRTALVVAKAPTTTSVSVSSTSVTATVDGGSLGAPAGVVDFTLDGHDLGTAPVVDGVATLDVDTTSDRDSVVAATYDGDDVFLPSTASTSRQDPTITASLDPVADGWSDEPVTVTFDCTAGSAPVICPAPVTLDTEGADQTVTRSVTAADGGTAIVTSAPVSIDLNAPAVRVAHVQDGAIYDGQAPAATCWGRDLVSGVASCTVTVTGRAPGFTTVVASAVDRAGNTSTATVVYKVRPLWVGPAGPAGPERGAWPAAAGEPRSIHLLSTGRPTIAGPSTAPGGRFHYAGHRSGIGHWVAVVRVPADVAAGTVLHYRVAGSRGERTVALRVTA